MRIILSNKTGKRCKKRLLRPVGFGNRFVFVSLRHAYTGKITVHNERRYLLLLEEHGHIPWQIAHLFGHLDIVPAKDVRLFQAPLVNGQDLIQGGMTLVVFAGLDFDEQTLFTTLKHEVQFTVFLLGKVVNGKTVPDENLHEYVFEYPAHIDGQIAIEDVELDVLHSRGTEQSRIRHKEHELPRTHVRGFLGAYSQF